MVVADRQTDRHYENLYIDKRPTQSDGCKQSVLLTFSYVKEK